MEDRDFYQESAEALVKRFVEEVRELNLQLKEMTADRDKWKRLAQHVPMSSMSAYEESIIEKHIKAEEYKGFQLLYGGKK